MGNWRLVAIALLGAVALFGELLTHTLLGRVVPDAWVQIPAAAGALLLAWLEWRVRNRAGRWRLVAFLAGVLALLYIGGIALLWLIWPT